MSEVFISHARSTKPKARQVADALRAAGHEVWLDEQLPTHRAYYEVLEERLRAADAVVVLWSKAAVESQWVRAEADLARSTGKLVQASLDDSLPPMPFNQIQCAQLKGWRGASDHQEWTKVRDSVAALSAGRPGAPTAVPPARRFGWKPWAVIATLAAMLAAGSLFLLLDRRQSASAVPRVAVLPFQALSRDPTEASFAAALADDVAGVLSENTVQILPQSQSETFTGPGREAALRRAGARYAISGTVRNEYGKLRVRVYLEDVDSNVTLWSEQFERPLAQTERMRDAVAIAITNTVTTALGTLTQPGLNLDSQTVTLFIKGENAFMIPQMQVAIGAMEQVVAREPRFAHGHASLATMLGYAAESEQGEARAATLRRMRKEAETAVRLYPSDSGGAYSALSLIAQAEPPHDLIESENFLLAGIRANPDDADLAFGECRLLVARGRFGDALGFCSRSAAASPLSAWSARNLAVAYNFAGQPDAANQVFLTAIRYHPDGQASLRVMHFEMAAFGARPESALAILRDPDQPPLQGEDYVKAMEAFIHARQTRAPVDEARALALFRDPGPNLSNDHSYFVLAAATFGRLDEAFAALDDPAYVALNTPSRRRDWVLNTLFEPAAAPLRRDPRFWPLAARLGLLDYWRRRGVWPDFCNDPSIGVDCKAAAAGVAPA